jgi:hypothetical protein
VVRNEKCDETVDNTSKRCIFNSPGGFLEMKYALTYDENVPSLRPTYSSPSLCRSTFPVRPGANLVIESN